MTIDSLEEFSKEPALWMSRADSYYIAVKMINYADSNPIPKDMNIEERYFIKEYLVAPDLFHIIHYLMGISFELMFKALLIKQNKDEKIMKSHNLLELKNKLKIEIFNEKEVWILKFLTEVIYNYGRYLNISNRNKINIGPVKNKKTINNKYFQTKYYNIVNINSYTELYNKIRLIDNEL